jgi:hypothetical protein
MQGHRVLANHLPLMFAPSARHFWMDSKDDLSRAPPMVDHRRRPRAGPQPTRGGGAPGPVGCLTRMSARSRAGAGCRRPGTRGGEVICRCLARMATDLQCPEPARAAHGIARSPWLPIAAHGEGDVGCWRQGLPPEWQARFRAEGGNAVRVKGRQARVDPVPCGYETTAAS